MTTVILVLNFLLENFFHKLYRNELLNKLYKIQVGEQNKKEEPGSLKLEYERDSDEDEESQREQLKKSF